MAQVMTPDNVRSFAGLKILSADQLEMGTCMGFYGGGGTGKTTMMAECVLSPHGTPALLMDIDGSSTSVSHLIPHGLDIVQVPRWQDVMKIAQAISNDRHPYKSVITDNLSELATLCMRNITTEPTPQIQHWGQMTSDMLRYVRLMRDLSRFKGINVFFSAWEETVKDEDAGYIRRVVNFTPKFAAAFPGIVTMLGHIGIANKPELPRVLTFAPSPKLDSKFRVAPTERAAKIPQVLMRQPDSHFIVDFLATVREGTPFPVEKYSAPQRRSANSSGG